MENTDKKQDLFRSAGVLLAPMAGFSDSSFRALCMSFGAGACTSEMISAKALRLGDRKSALLMKFTPAERPFGIQIFGGDPDDIAFAASAVQQSDHQRDHGRIC